jgi:hypothetical protein
MVLSLQKHISINAQRLDRIGQPVNFMMFSTGFFKKRVLSFHLSLHYEFLNMKVSLLKADFHKISLKNYVTSDNV